MSTQSAGRRLGTRRPGVARIALFAAAAAGPLYAAGGVVPATYVVSGSAGVPLAFLLLAPVLALFTVGYAAMSRHVTNAGAFYPCVARGIGKSTGAAVSYVTVIAFSAFQFGGYGLFGRSVSEWLRTRFGVDVPWWLLALPMVLVVGAGGVLRIDFGAKALSVALGLEIAVLVVLDAVLFTHPDGGAVSFAPLAPASLFPGGAVFAFAPLAFLGFGAVATYGEGQRTAGRAAYLVLGATAVLAAVTALAMAVAAGPGRIAGRAAAEGPRLLFGLGTEFTGPAWSGPASVLFLTGQAIALLTLHNVVARYFFALGRDGLLPDGLSRTSKRTAAPIGGSLTQTAIAAVAVALFAVTGRDPFTDLFTWAGIAASIGVVIVLIAVSLSVLGFFRRRDEETVWRRRVAPALAAVLLTTILVLIVADFDVLLGRAGTVPLLRWALPGLLVLAGLAGFLRAEALRTRRPAVYAAIGGPPRQPDDAGRAADQ